MNKNFNTLQKSAQEFGYHRIVLFYEEFIATGRFTFNANKNPMRKFLVAHPISETKNASTTIQDDRYKKKDTEFIVIKKHSKLSKCVSFFCRMRNCFAHGNAEVVTIGKKKYLCFEDYNMNKRADRTMQGQIPLSTFTKFIEEFQSCRIANP